MWLLNTWGFPGGTSGKEPAGQSRRCKRFWSHPRVREDPLEKGTATHFSVLAWRIPWIQSPKKSLVGHNPRGPRVGHD